MNKKDEFYKLKTPWELLEFMKANEDIEYDENMIEYFNKTVKEFSVGETQYNHSDPREAFKK